MSQIYLLFLLLGLIFGSFVNALVWRMKNNLDWIKERSKCSHCNHTLSSVDLIPVFSWLLLKGRCRYCSKKINDSPITELSVGLSFMLSYLFWPYGFDLLGSFRLVLWLIVLVILASLFLYDLKWLILPNKLVLAFTIISIFQLILFSFNTNISHRFILQILLSVLIGGGIFHLIYIFSRGKYIGGGDVKLGYAYGIYLMDPVLSWMVLLFASLLGSVASLILMKFGKFSLKSKIPFGPFLLIGVFIANIFGLKIWNLIVNKF